MKSAVGKILMIKSRYPEHANDVKNDAEPHGKRACPDPDNPETAQVKQKQRHGIKPVYALCIDVNGFGFYVVVGAEVPAQVFAKSTDKFKHNTPKYKKCGVIEDVLAGILGVNPFNRLI